MRLTVLGGCGGWPAAGLACSGYLVEHDGFRLLIDPGYAVVPRLLAVVDAAAVDAVLVSHGHPDHCADLTGRLAGHGLRVTAWYGVRVFTDTAAGDAEPPPDLAALLDCEERAGRTDPYRQVAALLHVIARKEAELCG